MSTKPWREKHFSLSMYVVRKAGIGWRTSSHAHAAEELIQVGADDIRTW
ncbi:MAG: hypothetical protein Q6373_006905 [Candidatus Sigynarchaeota archaeon]